MSRVVVFGAPTKEHFEFVLGDGTHVVGSTSQSGMCRLTLDLDLPADLTVSWDDFVRRLKGARSLQDAFLSPGPPTSSPRERKLLQASIGALNGDPNWWCLLRQAVREYPESRDYEFLTKEAAHGKGDQGPEEGPQGHEGVQEG